MTDTTREAVARAQRLITAQGWRPGDKPSLHSMTQLMVRFAEVETASLKKLLHDMEEGHAAAIAAYEAVMAESGMEWQPIETAPKKAAVLIAGGTYSMGSSFFQDEPFAGVTIAWGKDGEWQGDNAGAHDEFYWHKPTHWRPLPAPPATKEPSNG